MSFIQFLGALEIGFIFSLVSMGVLLSFRVLNFADVTADGTFPLGASVCAILIVNGVSPIWATFASIIAGALAGWVTAFFATNFKVLPLLAGILTMTGLYSINLRVMGRPNIALLNNVTLFSDLTRSESLIMLFLIAFGVCIALIMFLKTHLGLAIRATGSNARMARAQGIKDKYMIWIGLALSNALIALGGSLFAQTQGFADVTMGVGTIIVGLAAVIIGEVAIKPSKIFNHTIGCLIGAILYRIVVALALNAGDFGFRASDLNLITALIVVFAMTLPSIRETISKRLF